MADRPFGPPVGEQLPSFTFAAKDAPALRSQGDRLLDVINVKDWGALGNGSHDDTSAIQAAADYLNSHGKGRLFFPPGTYRIDSGPIFPIRWNDTAGGTVSVCGAGRDATVLRGSLAGQALVINQDTTNRHAVLENLTIWNESTVAGSYCYHSPGCQINLIQNCRFKGLNGTNTVVTQGGGMHIGNCVFEGLSIPRADATTGGATIPGNNNYMPTTFLDALPYDPCTNHFTVGAFICDGDFIGNHVSGFDVGLVCVSISRVIIGNTFSRCRTGIALQSFYFRDNNRWN
jgi:hypothetical protein